MRVAMLSDIHANLTALEAVLDHLEPRDIDFFVSLGDTATFGPQPREVLDRLHEMNFRNVMGNTDAWLLDPKPQAIRDADTPRQNHIELWSADQLTAEHKDYVRTFERSIELDLGHGARLLCYHGSPRSNRDFLRATTPDLELEAMLAGRAATVMAGGHTHEQMLRRYKNVTLVNAGSVGQACEWGHATGRRHYPWAEYAIVESNNGDVSVQLGRIPFDVQQVSQTAHDRHMPHADWWVALWNQT
ncbi:MAG: metallophosphoesterase family protein [FCB group bacterium]|jgi:putative phosphoesterase|nr:metallophosphoesterase family protein [FCB group bacterium]